MPTLSDRPVTADEAAFFAAMDAAPFDSAPQLVYADWLLEQGRDVEAERVRQQVAREFKEGKVLAALQTALETIDPATVPVMSTDRDIPRKVQAALARDLFKRLGLKGVSVTAPNHSMAQGVDVLIPNGKDWKTVGAKIEAILTVAFPNHDDRSDPRSDYSNFRWSINIK